MSMAEITATPNSRRRRASLPPARVDMTPMVDLAFLLLTFFILTTSLRRLEGLELVAPLNGPGKPSENALTFLVGGRDTLYGYAGTFDPENTVPRRYGADQVRQALRTVKDTATLRIAIKPRPNARYADVLGVVDACVFARLGRYNVEDSVPVAEWRAAFSSTR
jgi:biopolymer transport protein ExbD